MAVISRYVPVDLRGRRAVIAGASIAGLATALALGERGAEVCLVEAEAGSEPESPEDAFARWARRRVPQARHSHAFLARLRNILLRAYPGFYAELLAAGAVEMNLIDFPPPSLGVVTREPGDAELTTIGCRRTTFEWLLRRHVRAAPWAEMLSGTIVEGLVARAGDPPEVRGVKVARESGRRTIAADLVVDATGRTSRAPAWLRDIGAAAPYEERSSSAILYYTRFYRRRPGREFPAPSGEPTMGDFGWVKFAIFPADDGTYSITFAPHVSFPRWKVLSQATAFEELARLIPGLAPFVDPDLGEPTPVLGRDVLAMGGLENFLRRFIDADGHPLAHGFFAIGDAAYHTNPLYGRGTSQAFMHASLLGEALDAASGDVGRAAALLDLGARQEIEPFYRASVAADHFASRKVGAEPGDFSERLWDSFFENGVLPATRADATVFRTFVKVMNMIDTPERAFTRAEVLERVLAVWFRGARFRARYVPRAPDHEKTLAAVEAALGRGEPLAAGA